MTQALTLFGDLDFHVPRTEGIKYAGSKLRLLPHILEMVNRVRPKTIFDGFAGTTRVSQALAHLGYTVFCNDLADWSRIFASAYLLNKKHPNAYRTLIDHLNSLPGKYGWFTENYGGPPEGGNSKRPFQIHNTMKLDAIREEIDALNLEEIDKAVALTSLMLALDEVDSTMGHYASYLAQWSDRSYKKMMLRVPLLHPQTNEHRAMQSDVFELLPSLEVDLAYYDPPYGSNNDKMPPSRVRYQAYYHIWKTVCLNDRPSIFGKANRRSDTSDKQNLNPFEDFRRDQDGAFVAVKAIEKLLAESSAKYILLSYSSGGRATAEELNTVINRSGTPLEISKINYRQNVMANMRWTNEWTREVQAENQEYLFLIER